jgi:hypothetical protein
MVILQKGEFDAIEVYPFARDVLELEENARDMDCACRGRGIMTRSVRLWLIYHKW